MTMKYIIYHQVKPGTDCPDGIMAAAVAKLKHPDAKLIGDVYRDNDDYPLSLAEDTQKYPFGMGDEVFIVDFSYDANWLSCWESLGAVVTVLDHHAAKFGMLSQFANAVLDEKECGATLAWKHFFGDKPDWQRPKLLHHVWMRDTGGNRDEQGRAEYYTKPYSQQVQDSRAINEALSHNRYEMAQEAIAAGADPTEYVIKGLHKYLLWDTNPNRAADICDILLEEGRSLIAERERLVDQACDRYQTVRLRISPTTHNEWIEVPFVQTLPEEDRVYSDVGNELCFRYNSDGLAWVMTSDGRNHLRSILWDTRPISQAWGGNGHPQASGFSRDMTHDLLTKEQEDALTQVLNGCDVYDYVLAKRLREVQRLLPRLVNICEPMMPTPSGEQQQPYFGAVATDAAREYLGASCVDDVWFIDETQPLEQSQYSISREFGENGQGLCALYFNFQWIDSTRLYLIAAIDQDDPNHEAGGNYAEDILNTILTDLLDFKVTVYRFIKSQMVELLGFDWDEMRDEAAAIAQKLENDAMENQPK